MCKWSVSSVRLARNDSSGGRRSKAESRREKSPLFFSRVFRVISPWPEAAESSRPCLRRVLAVSHATCKFTSGRNEGTGSSAVAYLAGPGGLVDLSQPRRSADRAEGMLAKCKWWHILVTGRQNGRCSIHGELTRIREVFGWQHAPRSCSEEAATVDTPGEVRFFTASTNQKAPSGLWGALCQ